MRTLIFFLLITSQSFAEDKPRREPVPGGARADHHFVKQWENMIQGQKFPPLPHESKLEGDPKKLPKIESRQRFVFQLDTRFVDIKNEIWDDGYYYYAYRSKDQGNLWIVVHPKYRVCFDDLTKKFDLMQWVSFENGEIAGWKQVVLEYPRQCLGQLKDTGSKLKTAKGVME